MIRRLWTLSVHTRAFLRRYMPTNILLDAIRTRRGLKWGVPAMLLAVPYVVAVSICTNLTDNGAPGWLHLIVLLCVWNALKFLWIGPVSLINLVLIRNRERRTRLAESRASRNAASAGSESRSRWNSSLKYRPRIRLRHQPSKLEG